MIRSRSRLAACAALFVVALVCASCGSSALKLHPVSGKLFHGTKAAEGATVVLHLKDGPPDAPKPSGTVGADGTFTLKTYPHGDGAPAGDYVVVATWYPPEARQKENAKNKLPEQYGGADTSPLRATVKSGPTELEPFIIPK